MDNNKKYKVIVFIPETHLEQLKEEVNKSMSPVFGNYDHVFSWSKVTGCWRPLEGSNPYQGNTNETETAEEYKLEFAVKGHELKKVIEKIYCIHPYEEPAIDIYEFFMGRDLK